MLSLKNVDSYYGESRVIENLSFEVEKGGIVGLIGRNGVGKSTTLKSIMGIVKTPKGEIIFDGENIIKKPVYERVKLGIGYVPQGRDIFSRMTVEENIELGLQPKGGKGKVPDYIYDLFPILPKFAKRKGGDLSGGQQQQLAIARALAAEPKILILDEATSSVDTRTEMHIQSAMVALMKNRTSLIIAHRLSTIRDADKIVVIDGGRVAEQGSHEELIAAKGCYYRLYQTQFSGVKT